MLNGKYLIKISYKKRITFLSIYFFVGYVFLSFVLIMNKRDVIGDTTGFFLSMIPSLIMGTGSALGEATIIGALRIYPKNLINGWSSGTGMAGIIGALLTLFFKMFKIETQFLYLFASPLSLIYLFFFLIQEKIFNVYVKPKENNNQRTSFDKISENTSEKNKLNPREENLLDSSTEENENFSSPDNNHNLNLKNLKIAFGYSKVFIINLGLVNKKINLKLNIGLFL